jgi:hypothetical protein
MRKILIISNNLFIGGAEKLIFELVSFALKNNIKPTVLILDNYNREHYDSVFEDLNVKVVRTRLQNIKHFRSPAKMFRSVCWLIRLKFFADNLYNSIHVIGLYNVDKVIDLLVHRHRFFWNVNNAIQFPDRTYPYSDHIFARENDTIVCINNYQVDEISEQYGKTAIKSKISLFKLFIAS